MRGGNDRDVRSVTRVAHTLTGSDAPPLLVWDGWSGSAGTGRDLLVVRKVGAAAAVTIDLLVASGVDGRGVVATGDQQ